MNPQDQYEVTPFSTYDEREFDMQIRIVNLNETNFRKKVLNGYFVLNSFWPW